MRDSNKNPGSSSSRQPPSSQNHERAWAELTTRYLNDLPHQLEGIRSILQLKDYDKVKDKAHRIKGTSGTYRLARISKSAARLERLADSRNPHTIAAAINKVMRLVELETKRLNSQTLSPAATAERNTND
jgi:HPt (histidine-containing phosphotransfer) domain-containing protein